MVVEQRGRQSALRHATRCPRTPRYRRTARWAARPLAQHLEDRPAAALGVALDIGAQCLRRHRVTVGVVGVFDQQAVDAERQHVDEAIAVFLGDAGVHDDRHLQAMGLLQTQLPPRNFWKPSAS